MAEPLQKKRRGPKKKEKQGNFIQIKDLYKFCSGSLAGIAKDMGLDNELLKTDFEHSKVFDWESAEKHRTEVINYNIQDVKCLRAIYQKLSSAFLENYGVRMNNYMTLAQLSLDAWGLGVSEETKKKLKLTPRIYEEKMRKAYRGGRIVCGRPLWRSHEWNEIQKNKKLLHEDEPNEGFFIDDETYEKITHFAVYGDVNSLYPWVMYKNEDEKIGDPTQRQRYPIGKVINYKDPEIDWYDITQKEDINRSIFCVDCIPPNNLAIAFLMKRNEKGEVEQSLEPIVKDWYTGPELLVAVSIGYKITKVYEQFIWTDSEAIFHEHIGNAYSQRQLHKGAVNLMYKLLMNSMTGKFGQKTAPSRTVISNNPADFKFGYIDTNLDGFIFSNVPNESEYTQFPIQLTIFILAYSRIEMWRNLERMNCISDSSTILYGDTDSYIMTNKAWEKLPKEFISTEKKEIGKIKQEVYGKIIRVTVNAPKFYNFEYITEKKPHRIMCMTRCKGIPHTGFEYPAMTIFKTNVKEENIEQITQFTESEKLNREKRAKNLPHRNNYAPDFFIDLKEYRYIRLETKLSNGKIETLYVNKIPSHYFLKIQKGKTIASSFFGSMIRNINIVDSVDTGIHSSIKTRNMVSNPWWSKGLRKKTINWNEGQETYPPGHWKLVENWDEETIDEEDVNLLLNIE